jgi:photosystem II stability/assembly factor-like uncharacterized protein
MYKSTDSGGSWTSSAFYPFAFDPHNPNTIYASVADHAGLSKSIDGGATWNEINNGLKDQSGNVYIAMLVIDPANPNVIYVATGATWESGRDGVFKSTDGGGTWSQTRIWFSITFASIDTLAIDPVNSNTIYAGGSVYPFGIVFKSTDNGATWSPSFTGLTILGSVTQLAIDPTNPNIVYAGSPSGVFKSTSGAQSWNAFNDGLTDLNINALTIDPGNASIIYAGTSGGVFKGSNGGSWTAANSGLTNQYVRVLVIDPVNTAIIYAGTIGGGIFKSTSGGASWSASNNGLLGHRLSIEVGSLAVDPGNANTIYAGAYGDGMYKSSNNGGSWSGINNGLPDQLISALGIDPFNTATVFVGTDGSGVFKTINGGESWSLASSGLESPSVYTLAIDPGNSNVIYAGTGGGVFKSTNSGGSWSAVSDPPLSPASLVIDPSNSQTLYAVAYYDCIEYLGCNSAVFKSTDGGITWKRSDNGAGFSYVLALAIDPINTATIYVWAYADSGSGMFKSTDGGGSWNAIGNGLPNDASSLAIDPVHSNVIYAGTYGGGVFKSADGGANWNPLNDGLANLNVNTLAIDASGNFLHAGTGAGVFDYAYSAATNPIDDARTFVHQHYLDFLNREPDQAGWDYWTNQITQCGTDTRCIHERRIGVSAAFFIEQEFQDTGYYIDRFYKASFGRQPTYSEFTADRSKVIGGSNLEASKQAFVDEWVQRAAFLTAYPNTLSNAEVVNRLFDSAGLTASTHDTQRQQEIAAMNAGRSRALVLRDVIEIPDFKNIPDPNDPRYSEIKQTSQYNPAFVLMQYFGYLHRDVDQSGYDFWLDVVNNREPNNYRGMVCSFLTSSEYQLRFGSMVTHSNADCAQ